MHRSVGQGAMTQYLVTQRVFRQIHRNLAPLVLLPVLITLVSGSLYQIASLAGQAGDYYWILQIHRGNFGIINLEQIFPFINGIGLLVMVGSGISMWIQMQRRLK